MQSDNVSYENRRLGVNNLQSMMRDISKTAALTQIYTIYYPGSEVWVLGSGFLLVLLSFTLHLFCIPCSSTRAKLSSEMVCKSTYMHDRVNKYMLLNILLIMHGQIKSKKLCRSSFRERDMLSNCVKRKPDARWLVIRSFFTSRNERFMPSSNVGLFMYRTQCCY